MNANTLLRAAADFIGDKSYELIQHQLVAPGSTIMMLNPLRSKPTDKAIWVLYHPADLITVTLTFKLYDTRNVATPDSNAIACWP